MHKCLMFEMNEWMKHTYPECSPFVVSLKLETKDTRVLTTWITYDFVTFVHFNCKYACEWVIRALRSLSANGEFLFLPLSRIVPQFRWIKKIRRSYLLNDSCIYFHLSNITSFNSCSYLRSDDRRVRFCVCCM